jgi:hypothetical protein
MPALLARSPHRDDAEVVLMRQRDPHIGGTGLLAPLDLPHLRRRQIRAVGIEPLGEAAHRAAHDALHVGLLDVVAHDERHHVVEHAKGREGFVGARHGMGQEAADDGKGDDRRRNENADEARA